MVDDREDAPWLQGAVNLCEEAIAIDLGVLRVGFGYVVDVVIDQDHENHVENFASELQVRGIRNQAIDIRKSIVPVARGDLLSVILLVDVVGVRDNPASGPYRVGQDLGVVPPARKKVEYPHSRLDAEKFQYFDGLAGFVALSVRSVSSLIGYRSFDFALRRSDWNRSASDRRYGK
jgi:hypothetical protein